MGLLASIMGVCNGCVSTQEWWYGKCEDKTDPIIKQFVAEGYLPAAVENTPGGSPALVLINPTLRAYRVLFLFVVESDKQVITVPFTTHRVCIATRSDGVATKAELGVSEPTPLMPPPSQRAED